MSEETVVNPPDELDEPPPRRRESGGNNNIIYRLMQKQTRLEQQLETARNESATLRTQAEATRGEVERLQKAADSNFHAKEVTRLTQELRGLKHRAKFDELALARGLRQEALADAWQLSGYQPEGDVADEARLAELLDAQRASRPYFFAAPAGDEPPPVRPAPASGRGGPPPNGPPAGGFVFNPERAATDPEYAMKYHAQHAEYLKQKRAAQGEF